MSLSCTEWCIYRLNEQSLGTLSYTNRLSELVAVGVLKLKFEMAREVFKLRLGEVRLVLLLVNH